jgi:hypothetical protein
MMSQSTVYRHLTVDMRQIFWHLRWVCHTLTNSENVKRVRRATELLALIPSIRRKDDKILSLLTTHGFTGISIGSNSGFGRTMIREQTQGDGSIVAKRCWRSSGICAASIFSTWCPNERSMVRFSLLRRF